MWALTYDCNASCQYCYLKHYTQPKPTLDETKCFQIAQKIVDSSFKVDAIWLTGGEPTIITFLAKLIRFFKNHNIEVVLNTNSIIDNQTLLNILESKPTGIVVSLDSTLKDDLLNSNQRSFTVTDIIERLTFIKNNKDEKTILATAVVLTKQAICGLYDYALDMKKLGVDYISLNPIYGSDEKITKDDILILKENIRKIENDIEILLPSKYYLSLIYEYYDNKLKNHYCPSLYNYFFIAPWGYIYPCSNENYQIYNGFEFDMLNCQDDWYHSISIIRDNYLKSWPKTTLSKCFSARCIGCFKVYYDTIFTDKD